MQKHQLDTGDNTEVNTSPRHRLNLVNLETAQHLAVKTTTFPKPVLAQLRENPHQLFIRVCKEYKVYREDDEVFHNALCFSADAKAETSEIKLL